MNKNNLNPVQRTLIITCGPLAQEAGEKVAAHLTDRSGPRPAIAVQAVETAALDESGITAVTTALTQISPPNLTAILASQGWQLINEAEINCILLCDAAAESGDLAGKLLKQISDLVYRHLGIETASLLIWLAGEAGDAFLADCLSVPIHASRGAAALSLRNEAGPRLPDESALTPVGAEPLTRLTAT
ncbi:MAG: hypothetical protein GY803_28270, partial [Chloroflexi bacterium]|nr:hypothetical protein [Chloroflexota bacterium]